MDFTSFALWFSFLFDFRYNRKYESITVPWSFGEIRNQLDWLGFPYTTDVFKYDVVHISPPMVPVACFFMLPEAIRVIMHGHSTRRTEIPLLDPISLLPLFSGFLTHMYKRAVHYHPSEYSSSLSSLMGSLHLWWLSQTVTCKV